MQGIAIVVGKDGEQVVNGGAPPLGFNWPSKPFASLYHLQSGSPPDALDEVALDEKTANAAGYKVGDDVPMVFLTTAPARTGSPRSSSTASRASPVRRSPGSRPRPHRT